MKTKFRLYAYHLLLMIGIVIVLLACFFLNTQSTPPALAQTETDKPVTAQSMMQRLLADQQAAENLPPMALTPCVGGMAGSYPCQNVDLMSLTPLSTFGATAGNSLWGWTDPLNGKEYALMGLNNGVGFVDISNPEAPIYLGKLPTHSGSSSWRDVRVYQNHAFVVSDNNGNHGMQVFNLTRLRNVPTPPMTFTEDAHYNQVTNVHTIAINEATGYAYLVGSNTCSGGLHMVNIQNPTSPTFAGCYSGDGYTHEVQCWVYNGPDTAYQGHEICFANNEDTLTIVDVTNKAAPVQLSRTGYSGRGFTHQSWITEDHRYLLMNDELDESNFGHNSRTRIWNITDLNAPPAPVNHDGPTPAIDHNLYIKGNYAYEANYRAGFYVLDISNIAGGSITEVAYFDVYPANNNPSFNGAWNNYPFFNSGMVIVSGIEQGLFVLRPNLGGPTPTPPPTNTPTNTPTPTLTPTTTNTPTPTNTPPPGGTIFFDNFETSLGWTTNPNGTDTVTTGMWERGDPQSTNSSGPKQLGTTVSGSNDLVTGRLAGSSAGSYDIDGGVTTIRSPNITLPASGNITLSFSYYMAHGTNSSSADYLRVQVVGSSTVTIFEELNAANDDDAVWATFSGSLNSFAGQTIYLRISAADASGASLVEGAVDDVRIQSTP